MGTKSNPSEQNNREKSDYIRVKAAYAKMKTAETIHRPLYIYGATGFGKTEMVTHYLRREKYTYYFCKNGRLEKDKKKRDRDYEIVVFDNLQFLKDEEERKKVYDALEEKDKWVILISRSPLPAWLKPAFMQNPFITVDEEDLHWTSEDIEKYFSAHGISLAKEDTNEIISVSLGNPMAIRWGANIAVQNGEYTPKVLRQATEDIVDYLERSLMEEWTPELVHFLMYMSFPDEFTVPLAEMITNHKDSYRLILEARELGNFIFTKDNETFVLLPVLRSALNKRARREWDSTRCNEVYYNAGKYYELNDRPLKALEMYGRSGNNTRIMELLIDNARKNPAAGHYFEMRRYYLALPEEDIKKDAILMSGMSMLYAILLDPVKSEYWYEQLKQYEKNQTGGLKREARSRLSYLDIALPQRDVAGSLDLMRAVPNLLFAKGIQLPEFSVTSNLPSTMNGGKDYSEWSKKDREIAATFGKVVSLVMGKYGKGMVNICLAESLYEKGGDTYEIMSMLGKGALEAEAGGKPEMEFAAAGVQVRLNLFHGNDEAAASILSAFEKKVKNLQADDIMKNLKAIQCRMALYKNDKDSVNEWLKQAPDEHQEFFVMERYRYLTKVRCYIVNGDYLSALYLLQQMDYYTEVYKRTLYRIETLLLTAITYFRMKNDDWRTCFQNAIELAREYSFIRGIAEEGAAIMPLWQDATLQKEFSAKDPFVKRLQEETARMARNYPLYLQEGEDSAFEITGKALEILKLQAEGLSYAQIAKRLEITESTVKYHCMENYKKLGVTGKAHALVAARERKLV